MNVARVVAVASAFWVLAGSGASPSAGAPDGAAPASETRVAAAVMQNAPPASRVLSTAPPRDEPPSLATPGEVEPATFCSMCSYSGGLCCGTACCFDPEQCIWATH